MVVIEDEIHCDWVGRFDTFEEAVGELERLAAAPWDREPNAAPCTSWRTCGREYWVLEFDPSQTPWRRLRAVPALNVSAKGVDWVDGFEQAWRSAGSA